MKTWIRAVWVAVVVIGGSGAWAASAVVWDPWESIYVYVYGVASEEAAIEDAEARCRRRGGRECAVLIACEEAGIGMIYTLRLDGRIRSIGASCGAATVDDANELAKTACNDARLDASDFGEWVASVSIETAQHRLAATRDEIEHWAAGDWYLPEEVIRRVVCDGPMDTCRCGGPRSSWND